MNCKYTGRKSLVSCQEETSKVFIAVPYTIEFYSLFYAYMLKVTENKEDKAELYISPKYCIVELKVFPIQDKKS